MNNNIDQTFKRALAEGVFPSADILVAKAGEIVFAEQYGAAREHTCFDISSLTKPIATATITMMLRAEGLLKLDDTVYQWLAGAREAHHRLMTIKMLLEHTAGLPDWLPYYRELPLSLIGTDAGKRFVLDQCFGEPLKHAPGEVTLYSDLGFIILGEILEQAGSEPLDALFSQLIAKPLGLKETFFVRTTGAPVGRHAQDQCAHVASSKQPSRSGKSDANHMRFAPTEDCPWRERVVHGEVHDQNAYALGGVAGHAGLFSTARDLHRFTLEFVRSLKGESTFIPLAIAEELVNFEKQRPSSETYIHGWDRPTRRNSASGRYFSGNSIGHLGYTGCSIWIDLEKDFWTILLTNRIHPTTTNQKIKAFRPQIHDLIYDELL